jgi:CheY-like chemotaxis protein
MEAIVLRIQGAIDRWSRWMRLSPPSSPAPSRRFLIVQIDGLSSTILDRALAGGSLRNLQRLLARDELSRRDLAVGLPTSTPYFQAALMYGGRPDIPGFHFHDKVTGRERHFPKRGVAHQVEQRHAGGRAGILEGGSCYGCIFTGGAVDSLWTYARLKRLTRAGSVVGRAALSALLLGWVFLKCLGLTLATLARALARMAMAVPAGRLRLRRSLHALVIDIGVSIWARQLFTLLVSADLYRGVPAIYVNFLDYDVTAHHFGPADRLAFRSLRRVDRSIQQLARIIHRLPELNYDLYVLSDHGQVLTRPFRQITRGQSLQDVVHGMLGDSAPADMKVVAAGPNAFVYFTDRPEPLRAAEIESRHPRLLTRLSRHPGVGLVLARATDAPACWYRGHRVPLTRRPTPGVRDPFARRRDRELVVDGLRELMEMPSAGDIVLYGTGAPGGDVTFIDELGAHAGPSEEELHTFILHPPSAPLPEEPLTHPRLLYPHFMAYRIPAPSARPKRPAAEPGGERALEDVHVLVVDDDEESREVMAVALGYEGARVTTVPSVAGAVAALERRWPDVLVSDIAMPGEDGYDLIRKVRRLEATRGRHLPAIAVTAYAGAEDRRRALEAGFEAHLAKPVPATTVAPLIASLLPDPDQEERRPS